MPYKQKINSLLLNYFIQEGYQEAAITFARETNVELSDVSEFHNGMDTQTTKFLEKLQRVDPSNSKEFYDLIGANVISKNSQFHSPQAANNSRMFRGYSTIEQRKEIKNLILQGKVTSAIQKVSEYFPTVLDSNNLLHFRLLRLNLIEMIRSHKLTSGEGVNNDEKDFLESVLEFVRENLINKVTRSFKLLKELEITMSLLCFNFDDSIASVEQQKDLPEELRSLFDLSLRTQCYRLVNRAILSLSSNDKSSNDNLIELEEQQRYFDKLKSLDSHPRFNVDKINKDDLEEYEESNEEVISELESEYNSLGAISSKNHSQDNFTEDETEEDENNKLQDLALESKLEKVVKLWTVTEQRLLDLKIIEEKRYELNNEFI